MARLEVQFGDIQLHFGDTRYTIGTSRTASVGLVDLVTLLPDPKVLRIRLATPPAFTVRALDAVDGPTGLTAALEASPVNLLVIDPADPRAAARVTDIIGLLGRYEWIPCIVYTTLSPAGVKPLPQFFGGAMHALLLSGIDDGTTAIREMIVRLTADAVANVLLDALARPIERLPAPLVRAIRFLFASPHRFPSVEDLAVAASMSRRHVHRLVTDAGLTSPTQLLVTARVLRAYQFLRTDDVTIQGAAERLRIAPRILARHLRLTTAVRSSRDLHAMQPAEIVTHCVRSLYRPPAALRLAVGDTSHAPDRSEVQAPPRPPRPGHA
jgi:AraC-like DNA-binding protein